MYNIPPRTIITYNKQGNIKTLSTKYDNDDIINSPIDTVGFENKNTLNNLFKEFGKIYGLIE